MERADWSVAAQVPYLVESWFDGGRTAQGAICCPADPPHLEDTNSFMTLTVTTATLQHDCDICELQLTLLSQSDVEKICPIGAGVRGDWTIAVI